MKKVLVLLVAAALVLGAVLALSACGKKKGLPSSDYEKVAFAFNGVEKSFQNAGKKSADAGYFAIPRLLSGEGDPLSTIRGLYTSGDNQGDVIDELEYTEPPMIQFQCLKAVLEKIGKNFSFGTKYYDEITGEVFCDPATGEDKSAAAKKDDYKYAYTFGLGLQIDIDENDLIKADVSFDICLTRGSEKIETVWYVGMDLDYDMTSTTPIYTLAMRTANDERELAFRGTYTYEYDYVDMRSAGINEWRKFVMESDVELVKDASHPTFASYREEGVSFRADTCKWYYDKALKKITRHDPDKDARIADAFFSFGLNSTDVDGQPFLSANGEKNSAITDAYRDFSAIFRKDVIYSLVTEKEDEPQGGHGDVVGIRVLTPEGEAWSTKTIENDCTISDLLSGFAPWGGAVIGVTRPCIWTVDAAGDKVDMLSNFSDYNYTITLGKGAPLSVDLGTRLSTVLANDLGGSAALEQNGFYITIGITDKNNPAYTTSFGAIVGFTQEIDQQTAKQFPAELTARSVPVYDTANGSYNIDDYKEGNDTVFFTVQNTNDSERTAYLNKLKAGGFVQDDINAYVKVVGQHVLFITVYGLENGSNLRISARQQVNNNADRTYSATFPAQAVASWVDGKFVIPTPTASGTLLYSYNADGKYIHIFGMTNEEISAFVDSIANRENTRYVGDRMITTYYEGRFYTIEYNAYENTLYFELNLERYGAQEPQIYISVNGGDAQPFWWDDMYYTVTVTLAEGDTFVITPDVGKIEDPKAFTFSEGTYTVVTGGTYVISGLQGDLHITKN